MRVSIVSFEPQYASTFKDLNIAWLEKYFYVEPKDEILLKNCKEAIIDSGGFIFFAKSGSDFVGCFSFIKVNEHTYELGKMAVNEAYQGHKIGQQLMKFAISFAKKKQWRKLNLYTSSKLPTAIHIYNKYGFEQVALEKELPYKRSDIKMQLLL